jgi:cardiolipin synthase A/B
MSSPLRLLADQAFSRAAGAPLIEGNAVQLLRDARENYPAWLDAIRTAKRWIHFESYIIHEDDCGREFAAALIDAARRGVTVRVIYDWLGSVTTTTWIFWHRLRKAGIHVRNFNQPRIDSPFGWLSRDHRKMLAVDGRVGFVTGLCVGNMWWGGDRNKGAEPWRDTGVAVRGPALYDIGQAFANAWAATGPALPADEIPAEGSLAPAGTIALRVIATQPSTAGVFRLDQLVASLARKRLWITDAYFVGASPYVQSLLAAAADDVDVRLLVPGSTTDLPVVQQLTRTGYRPLLEAGVRIFEWNGTMVHAKTAVADGLWARVGSSNLNIQSWLGNWELDVAIEDADFGRQMEDMFRHDLENATEVVLDARRMRPTTKTPRPSPRSRGRWSARRRTGRTRRAATAGALRAGRTFGAALTARRALGAAEAVTLLWGTLLIGGLGFVGLKWPRALAYPLGVFLLWVAAAMVIQAVRLWRQRSRAAARATEERKTPRVDAA